MRKRTLLVIGNCQARPVTTLLGSTGHFDCLAPILLHLAKPGEREEHLARIVAADVVLAQKTADNFPLPHLRSTTLRANHPGTVVWPNIFFSGQQPFLRYMTHATAGRLVGPLETLHDLRWFLRWRHARGLEEQPWAQDEEDLGNKITERSMADLLNREAECDIRISDYIADRMQDMRLFFTFNHPTRCVLEALCNRILAQDGLEPLQPGDKEFLDRYLVPSLWPEGGTGPYRGDKYELGADGRPVRITGKVQVYTPAELQAAFFEIYDHEPAYQEIGKIRFTPNFPFDPFIGAA